MFSFLQKRLGFKEKRPRLPRLALAVDVLEDRCVPAIVHVGPTQPITTIQGGVNAANPGDTVLVDPGTYTEQVTVAKSITLQGSGQASTFIQAPANLIAPFAIVEVSGAATNATIQAFTIRGPGSPTGNLLWGIRVDNGGSALITNNHLTSIRDNPLSGVQSATAIDVGRNNGADVTTGSAVITNNVIDDYQKAGILVDNTGSNALIANNVITGAGPTAVIAQNGMQISRGATATVRGNSISANVFTGGGNSGTGILLFNPGAVSLISNVISRNDIGISDIGGNGAIINSNQVTRSTNIGIVLRATTSGAQVGSNTTNFNGSGAAGDAGIVLNDVSSNFVHNNQSEFNNGDGILVDATSSGNLLFQNQLKFNSLFDAQDLSVGAGTSGTANVWTQNLGNTSSPPGLANTARTFDARSRWGSFAKNVSLFGLRILSLQTPKPPGIP